MAIRGDRHPSTSRVFVIRTPPVLSTAKLAALPWAHAAAPFRAIAHEFVVRTCDPALGEYLGAVLDPFAVDGSAGDGQHAVPAYSIVDRGDAAKNRYALYFGRERLALTPPGGVVVATRPWPRTPRAAQARD